MKAKDLFQWWWNYDAPWWVWLLLILLFGIFPIHLTIKF